MFKKIALSCLIISICLWMLPATIINASNDENDIIIQLMSANDIDKLLMSYNNVVYSDESLIWYYDSDCEITSPSSGRYGMSSIIDFSSGRLVHSMNNNICITSWDYSDIEYSKDKVYSNEISIVERYMSGIDSYIVNEIVVSDEYTEIYITCNSYLLNDTTISGVEFKILYKNEDYSIRQISMRQVFESGLLKNTEWYTITVDYNVDLSNTKNHLYDLLDDYNNKLSSDDCHKVTFIRTDGMTLEKLVPTNTVILESTDEFGHWPSVKVVEDCDIVQLQLSSYK